MRALQMWKAEPAPEVDMAKHNEVALDTARRSDAVTAFGIRVEGEGFDLANLTRPWSQTR
jgi:beta-glucosidase